MKKWSHWEFLSSLRNRIYNIYEGTERLRPLMQIQKTISMQMIYKVAIAITSSKTTQKSRT